MMPKDGYHKVDGQTLLQWILSALLQNNDLWLCWDIFPFVMTLLDPVSEFPCPALLTTNKNIIVFNLFCKRKKIPKMTPTLMSLLPVVANVARHTKFQTGPGVVLLASRAGNEFCMISKVIQIQEAFLKKHWGCSNCTKTCTHSTLKGTTKYPLRRSVIQESMWPWL